MWLIVVCFALACVQASGQILLRVNDAQPTTVTAEALDKLPRHTAVLNDHGKQMSYEGALLRDVLPQANFDFAKGLHGKQLSTYVKAVAKDGYEVVFALAEFDPTLVDSEIIVADKRDGQSLTPNDGPFRIVVPNDKRPARCLRMLQEIDVVELRGNK